MHSCWGNYLQKKYVANRREIWCKSERNMVQIGEKYVANRREIRRKSGKSCESGGRCWWQSKFWPQYARDHLPTGGSILSNFLSRQKPRSTATTEFHNFGGISSLLWLHHSVVVVIIIAIRVKLQNGKYIEIGKITQLPSLKKGMTLKAV